MTHKSPLLSVDQLQQLINSTTPPTILDVRYTRDQPGTRQDFDAGHIAGAHFVDLPRDLQGTGGGLAGARPLPSPADLQNRLQRWGVEAGRPVVVTGLQTDSGAARAWFVLTWAGVKDVFVLDGGLAAWKAAGLPLVQSQSPAPDSPPSTIEITATGALPVLDAAGIANHLAQGHIALDARGRAGYENGHIPGAISLPSSFFINKNGHLNDESQIRHALAQALPHPLGPDSAPLAVYCGGGMAASLATLALFTAGIPVHHFVGSYSAWSADPSRPTSIPEVTRG